MILDVNGVTFHYRSTPVLRGITFALRCNELLVILGPNGAGKTTLLKCMNAILKPQTGSILIEREDVRALSQMDVARRFGYVSQRVEAARLTAFDAVLLGRRPHLTWNISERDLRIVDAALKRLNLEGLSLRYIDEMSGGELQKVSIARALVQEPKVLLLDEPTSNLDLKNQFEILKIIREVVGGHAVAAVMTMHNLNTALRYSDKVIFLKNGTVFAAGDPRDITSEMIEAVYGVRVAVEQHRGHPIIVPID